MPSVPHVFISYTSMTAAFLFFESYFWVPTFASFHHPSSTIHHRGCREPVSKKGLEKGIYVESSAATCSNASPCEERRRNIYPSPVEANAVSDSEGTRMEAGETLLFCILFPSLSATDVLREYKR